MAIVSTKLGPGTLKLGTGGAEDVSCQMRACAVNPSEVVESSEAVPVLCGEEIAAEESVSFEYTLSGTAFQDLLAAGMVDYTWTNAGDEVDFEFIPVTALARKVTGTVRLVPLTIGGEVSKTELLTSDFEWRIIGTPVFGAVA
jgi:hypothetical protein